MIKHVTVRGLHGKHDFDIDFKQDLTLFTGQNGSGKTSLLKLIWCLVSPNRGLALNELRFDSAKVETDKYVLEVVPNGQHNAAPPYVAKFIFRQLPEVLNQDEKSFDVLYDDDGYVRDGADRVEELNALLRPLEDKTIFFPTYRRIEGGFASSSWDVPQMGRRMFSHGYSFANYLDDFAERLSSEGHTFVTSISTRDIKNRLVGFSNGINEKTNELYLRFSKEAEQIAAGLQSDCPREGATADVFDKLEKIKLEQAALRLPLDNLSALVKRVFKDGGIRISESLTLGDPASAISANALSAGEKQMFGFLSYNAFLHDAIIFIDEPELSLHVDWQRQLFEMLLEQDSTNQFIATTHSPFIYAYHADKEFFLDENRGWMEEDVKRD